MLVLIVAVMLVPLALGISYAFRDVQILNPFSGGFVGLDHFRALAEDEAFFRRAAQHLLVDRRSPSSSSSSSA